MRAELGPILLISGYCLAGLGVLAALGFVHSSVGGVVAALGLAFMVGVAVVLLAGIALLCAGVPVGIGVLADLAALFGLGGLGVAWWRTGRPPPHAPSWARVRSWASMRPVAASARVVRGGNPERWGTVGAVLAFAVFAVLTYRWARVQPLVAWDSWSIWARKGTLLSDYGHLPTAFFTSPVYATMHPDYPLLLPLYESSWFRVVGSADTQSLHAWFWVLFVASLWATAYVASQVTRPAIWAPLVGLLAVTPEVWSQLMTMYADVPMGLFLMVGVLLLGLWITGRRRRDLALSAILLAAAASTKNEGLTAASSALGVAVLFTLAAPGPGPTRRRALAALLAAVAAFAVTVVPWRWWLAAHHIAGEIPVGHGLDPAFLLERGDRLSPTVSVLFEEATNQGHWSYLLPIFLALEVAGLASRGVRRVAAFYGLATLSAFVMVVWGYVVSGTELSWLIATSSERTVVGPMLIAAAGMLHLASGLLAGAVKSSRSEASRALSARALASPGAQSVSSG